MSTEDLLSRAPMTDGNAGEVPVSTQQPKRTFGIQETVFSRPYRKDLALCTYYQVTNYTVF
jgi:hypothetical protein